ncbi:MAG: hypothetical protein JWO62_3281 [Acidimicrobiaceae bacterium]|jgi:hypothetical protein|nr:hypothetical protein [Acidimicrobiaceae bacterium]
MSPTGAGTPTGEQWLAAFAERLGVSAPSPDEVDQLLALAGTAAHASERTAAPVACWLAARAGVAPERASEIAGSMAVEDAADGRTDPR